MRLVFLWRERGGQLDRRSLPRRPAGDLARCLDVAFPAAGGAGEHTGVQPLEAAMSRVVRPGARFGRWTVVAAAGSRYGCGARWQCRCLCGTEREVCGTSLRLGRSKSCGCRWHETSGKANLTHGESKRAGKHESPEYTAWRAMKDRCGNRSHKEWKHYGGRGISVCRRWLHSFERFLADVGRKPSVEYTLGRLDNDKNYTPRNVAWQTRVQQARNTQASRIVRIGRVSRSVAEWSEVVGLLPAVIHTRIYRGWDLRAAVLTPLLRHRRRTG